MPTTLIKLPHDNQLIMATLTAPATPALHLHWYPIVPYIYIPHHPLAVVPPTPGAGAETTVWTS